MTNRLEKRPLFGRRVLVPRSEGQSAEVSALLRRRGAEPVLVALLEFEPPSQPERLEQALAGVDRYDWLVFTSANAVGFAAPHLAREALHSVRVACIGPATAEAARAAGLSVHAVPEARSLPEELAAQMAACGPLRGARVLLPRSARARDTLPRALEQAGARVDSVEAYRTILPPGAEGALRAAIREGLDAVMLTSPSAVDHLLSLLGERETGVLARAVTIACIGPSTAGHLRERGLEPDIVSERQSGAALVDALESWFREQSSGVS